MKIVNLGCGSKTSSNQDVVNVDYSVMLRMRSSAALRYAARFLLNEERRNRFNALPQNIMVHNIAKGLPFPDDSCDVVYHSHLFEHLDPPIGLSFLREIKRVLKPGGIIRIVVPDLEQLCRDYISHLELAKTDPTERPKHNAHVAEIIGQCVRREAAGTSIQSPARRRLENMLLGDARARGETHQWMYDEVNLGQMLIEAEFSEVRREDYDTSSVTEWDEIGLDRNADGSQYKPGSLYMEARRPLV